MNRYPWLDEFLLSLPGAQKDFKPEWGWWRYQVGGRLFAATCQPGPQYQGYDCRELVNLKCDPLLSQLLRGQYRDVIPGFYCDKRCWISVFLDGQLPDEELRQLCRASYDLVFAKLTKTCQRQILAEAGLPVPPGRAPRKKA